MPIITYRIKMKITKLFLFSLLFLTVTYPVILAGEIQNYAENEVIIKFKSTATDKSINKIIKKYSLQVIEKVATGKNLYYFRIINKSKHVNLFDTIDKVKLNKDIEYVQPNYKYKLE